VPVLTRRCLTNGELAGSIPIWLHNNPCLEPFLQGTDVGTFHNTPHYISAHKKLPGHQQSLRTVGSKECRACAYA
jgi:hypothetical protein